MEVTLGLMAAGPWIYSLKQESLEDRSRGCFFVHPEEEEPERILKLEGLRVTWWVGYPEISTE